MFGKSYILNWKINTFFEMSVGHDKKQLCLKEVLKCVFCLIESSVKPPIINIHFILTIQICTLANGQLRLDNTWVRQTNQHMLFTGKYRCKTQCLSKEIGVGVAIPCWRRSQLLFFVYFEKKLSKCH